MEHPDGQSVQTEGAQSRSPFNSMVREAAVCVNLPREEHPAVNAA